eukprot:gene19091-18968_t
MVRSQAPGAIELRGRTGAPLGVGPMRVLLIDPDPARAALVAEGLAGVDPLEVRQSPTFDAAEAHGFEPDVIVVACDSPDRDILESLREASLANPRPVVMFADRSEPGLAEQTVRAGVAAYVVNGLAPDRVRPVLEVAMSRFSLMQQLRGDLARAKADLESRKIVDRAKGLLMKERGLDEAAAYGLLRKLAMDKGRPIGAVAADLLAFACGFAKQCAKAREVMAWQPDRINLGSGKDYQSGWLNLAIPASTQPDLLLDLSKPLALPLRVESPSAGPIELLDS